MKTDAQSLKNYFEWGLKQLQQYGSGSQEDNDKLKNMFSEFDVGEYTHSDEVVEKWLQNCELLTRGHRLSAISLKRNKTYMRISIIVLSGICTVTWAIDSIVMLYKIITAVTIILANVLQQMKFEEESTAHKEGADQYEGIADNIRINSKVITKEFMTRIVSDMRFIKNKTPIISNKIMKQARKQ